MLRKPLFGLVLVALVASWAPLAVADYNWSLAAGDSQEDTQDTDPVDWDDDVLNLTLTQPGVLHIQARGTAFTGSSGSEDVCGGGSRNIGSLFSQTNGSHSIPLRAGDYTFDIGPHNVATWVRYRLKVRLLDDCSGVAGDDHGDMLLCATEMCLSTSTNGNIGGYTGGDVDYLSFVLSSSQTVTVESSGSTDVVGELYDEGGTLLAEDDDSGSGDNFSITESLAAGRYFVRVTGYDGATGNYAVEASY